MLFLLKYLVAARFISDQLIQQEHHILFYRDQTQQIGTMLGSLFIKSSAARKYKWVKAFLQNIRTYKKSGVRLREAQLLSPNGELMTKYGEATITDNDVMVS